MQPLPSSVSILLRIAIAFVFLYPAISGFFMPLAWVGFFPAFIQPLASPTVLMDVWGIVEVIIALWILSGKHIFLPSLAAGLLLCAIIMFNVPSLDIVFRDVALALVAFALAGANYPWRTLA